MTHPSGVHGDLERKPGGPDNWIERLPKALQAAFKRSWIYRTAKHLHNDEGMSISHAFGVANNAAKKGCATGDLNWPGSQSVNPGSRAEMCASVATWKAMMAANVSKSVAHDMGFIHKRLNRSVPSETLCEMLGRDEIIKRDFSAQERRDATDEGKAIHGSYPIYNKKDLENAVKLWGHADSNQRAHIRRRARALGCEDILPGAGVSKSDTGTYVEISKVDDEQRNVFGWASVGIDKEGNVLVDRQGDQIDDPDEIEKAAYDFVLHSRDGGEEHIRTGVSKMVESFVTTPEKLDRMGIPPGTLPVGWWVGFHVTDPQVWEGVKSGRYTGFSVHGSGIRKDIEE